MRSTRWLMAAIFLTSGCTLKPESLPDLSLSGKPFRHLDASTMVRQASGPSGGTLGASDPNGSLVSGAAPHEQWDWVDVFADPLLTNLVDGALKQNLEIQVADARIDRARAILDVDKSYTMPTVRAGASFNRSRVSGDVDDALPKRTLHNWSVPLDASYEIDAWGRINGQVMSAKDFVLAADAELGGVKLGVATEIASDYLTLRFIDFDRAELVRSIALRQMALDLIRGRVKAGYASDLDALRASTELKTASAELAESDRLRENLVDAIAVLAGRSVTDVQIDATLDQPVLPVIPVGLPSEIVENRPDIYAARRRLDASSLQVGIAKTAFLPSFTLNAGGGFASNSLRTFLDRNSSLWGLGFSMTEALFDGGRRRAGVKSAKADYAIAQASYRATVLEAFRQVQDALNSIAAARLQVQDYGDAATASAQAAALSRSRYEHGYVSYFEVVDADRSALAIKRQLIRSQQAQAVATVSLLRALGGGWRSPGQGAPSDIRPISTASSRS